MITRLDNAFDMWHDKRDPIERFGERKRASIGARKKSSARFLLDFSSRGVHGQPAWRSRHDFLPRSFQSNTGTASSLRRRGKTRDSSRRNLYPRAYFRTQTACALWMHALIIHSWQGKTPMIRRLASTCRVARRNSHAVRAPMCVCRLVISATIISRQGRVQGCRRTSRIPAPGERSFLRRLEFQVAISLVSRSRAPADRRHVGTLRGSISDRRQQKILSMRKMY